jgi:hypothetical protein
MKTFRNVLSESLIRELGKDRETKPLEPCWYASEFFWDEGLKTGVAGNCLTTLVAEPLRQQLIAEIAPLLPACDEDELIFMHYIWTRGSGISGHDDHGWRFGATIYLNESWDMNFGGLFAWKTKESEALNLLCPEYNTIVLNDDSEQHYVTQISPLSTTNRITLQIFGGPGADS